MKKKIKKDLGAIPEYNLPFIKDGICQECRKPFHMGKDADGVLVKFCPRCDDLTNPKI